MTKNNFSNSISLLNNASKSKVSSVLVSNTKLIKKFLLILNRLNFIDAYTIISTKKIQIFLKYTDYNFPSIKNIRCVSTPSRRFYVSLKSLEVFSRNNNAQNVFQIAILSTPCGLLTHHAALERGVGGELLVLIK